MLAAVRVLTVGVVIAVPSALVTTTRVSAVAVTEPALPTPVPACTETAWLATRLAFRPAVLPPNRKTSRPALTVMWVVWYMTAGWVAWSFSTAPTCAAKLTLPVADRLTLAPVTRAELERVRSPAAVRLRELPATIRAWDWACTPPLTMFSPLTSRWLPVLTVMAWVDANQPVSRLVPPAVMLMLRPLIDSPLKSAPRTLMVCTPSRTSVLRVVTTSSTVIQLVCTSSTCISCRLVTSAYTDRASLSTFAAVVSE